MEEKIKIGVSSCLLGEKVRYDGGHKLDTYLTYTLGQFVEWVPVCPEVEYGLSTPREEMCLVGDPENPRLETIKTGVDHTSPMIEWAQKKIIELEQDDLCGFIFKSGSPSSGMYGVRVYSSKGTFNRTGIGIFAKIFMDNFPSMPVEDDERLHDPQLRERFFERIFGFKRLK